MLPHRRASRLINFVIVACLIGFVLLFLQRPQIIETTEEDKRVHFEADRTVTQIKEVKSVEAEKKPSGVEPESSLQTSQISPPNPGDAPETREQNVYVSEELNGWANDLRWKNDRYSSSSSTLSIKGREVVESVNYLNDNFVVLNTDRYGPVETVKTVIVVQVHTRLEYLRYLVDTLSKTKGIQEALLVFSHDINIEPIDNLVRNISFARVIQIFYPYNMQLFPHVFPGQDPRDCPEKMKKEEAHESGCHNWEHPDKYGNYRVAKFTQIKHHWWWKMNYVFDGIISRYNLTGWVLLLEEDHYVSPDALHVLNYIVENKQTLCADCELISLGFYLKTFSSYGSNIDRLGVHPWFSSKHNMGMALTRDTWAKIKNCSELFCSWDDYNWDWSMLQISVKCLPQRFKVIFTKSPRVLHVGDCGVHTHRCAVHNAAKVADELFTTHNASLFPQTMKVSEVSRRMLKPSKENGGWGDARDRALCARNTNPLRVTVEGDPGHHVLDDLYASDVQTQKISSSTP